MPPSLVMQTLNAIWPELCKFEYPVALVGGLVLPIWNYPRSTHDIDVLLMVPNEVDLLRACGQLGCHPRRSPPLTELGSIRVLQTHFRPSDQLVDIAVDFLVGSSEFHRLALQRSVTVDFETVDTSVRVVTCEDLILLKLQSGRLIDLADCQRLIELNRDEIDWEYVNKWSELLKVQDELQQVCRT